MKILIAEDDAVASNVLQLTLERMGHEVVVTQQTDRNSAMVFAPSDLKLKWRN